MANVASGQKAKGQHEAVQLEIEQAVTALPWVCIEIDTSSRLQQQPLVRLLYGQRTTHYRELSLGTNPDGANWILYSGWRSVAGAEGKTIEALHLDKVQFNSFQNLMDYVESLLLDPLEYLAIKAKMNPRQRTLRIDDWKTPVVLTWKQTYKAKYKIVWTYEDYSLTAEAYHGGRHYVLLSCDRAPILGRVVDDATSWAKCVKDIEIQVAGGELPLLARAAKRNPPEDEQRAARKRIQHFCSFEAKSSGFTSAKITKSLGKDKNGNICFLVRITAKESFWANSKLDEASGLHVAYAIFPACRMPGGWGVHPVKPVSDLELLGLLGPKSNPRQNKVYSARFDLLDNATRMTSPSILPWKIVYDEPDMTIWHWIKSKEESWEIRSRKNWDGRKARIVVSSLKYDTPDSKGTLCWDGRDRCVTHIRSHSNEAFSTAVRRIEEEIAGGELGLLALAAKPRGWR